MSSHRYSDEDFKAAIASSFSISETLRKLGLCGQGGSYATFHSRAKKLGIDFSHFTGQGHLKNKTHNWSKAVPLSEVLIADSDRTLSSGYKKRIIKAGLLKEECTICKLPPEWQGKPITLQIDHINGDHFDHRIENLRLLCPNCHSQTDTFCSKNGKKYHQDIANGFIPQAKVHVCVDCGKSLSSRKYKRCRPCDNINAKPLRQGTAKPIVYCLDCGVLLKDKNSIRCPKCYHVVDKLRIRKTKITWPCVQELKTRVAASSYLAVARELGVSDNAVRKRIKTHND